MSVGDVINDATNLAFKPVEAIAGVLPLTKSQPTNLSTILMRAGWGPKDSPLNRMARAVVQRESGGDPSIHSKGGFCSTKGDIAIGLFQVCTVNCGVAGSPHDRTRCETFLENPVNNARVAKALHASRGWQPWQASGGIPSPTDWDPVVSKKDVSIVGAAVDDATGAVGTVVSPFTSVVKAATDLIGTLLSADTWLRIGKGSLGFGFLIIGTGALVYVAANTASGGQAGNAVKKAAAIAVVK